ncbi:MAG: hypothetical protein KA715_10215 [Xanthomonadaceae bacterium]|nr:hypothetical protein [Xanthomonadaceae bacterium]
MISFIKGFAGVVVVLMMAVVMTVHAQQGNYEHTKEREVKRQMVTDASSNDGKNIGSWTK